MSQRLSISFDSTGAAALAAIKKSTNAGSVADVVRQSLSVLSALIEAEKRGCEIILRSGDGQQFRYSLARPNEMTPIGGTPQQEPNVIALNARASRGRALGAGKVR
jgi:hypothetical protein